MSYIGFGVLFVLTLLEPIRENFLFLFIGSVILTSVLEFITGFLLEKVFKMKWWITQTNVLIFTVTYV